MTISQILSIQGWHSQSLFRMGSGFQCRLEITEKSYLNRATVCFNKLPSKLRQIRKLETFKKQLKAWVLENCQVWRIYTPGKTCRKGRCFTTPLICLGGSLSPPSTKLYTVQSSIEKKVVKKLKYWSKYTYIHTYIVIWTAPKVWYNIIIKLACNWCWH